MQLGAPGRKLPGEGDILQGSPGRVANVVLTTFNEPRLLHFETDGLSESTAPGEASISQPADLSNDHQVEGTQKKLTTLLMFQENLEMGRLKKKNMGKKGNPKEGQADNQSPSQPSPASRNEARNAIEQSVGHNRKMTAANTTDNSDANKQLPSMPAAVENLNLPDGLYDAFCQLLEAKIMNIADCDSALQGWKNYKPSETEFPLVHQALSGKDSIIIAVEYHIFGLKSKIEDSFKRLKLPIDGRKVEPRDVSQKIVDRIDSLQKKKQREKDALNRWKLLDLRDKETVELLTDIFIKGTKRDVLYFEYNYLARYVMEKQKKREDPEQKPQFSNSPDIGQNLPLPKSLYDAIHFQLRIKKVTVTALTSSINGWEHFEPTNNMDISAVNKILSSDAETLSSFEYQVFTKKKTISDVFKLANAQSKCREVNKLDVAEKVIRRIKNLIEKRSHFEKVLTNWKMLDLRVEGIVDLLSNIFLAGTNENRADFEDNRLPGYVMKVQREGLGHVKESQNDSKAEIVENAQEKVVDPDDAPSVDADMVTDTVSSGVRNNVVPRVKLVRNYSKSKNHIQENEEAWIAQEPRLFFTAKTSFDVSFNINKSWEVAIKDIVLGEPDQSANAQEKDGKRSSIASVSSLATMMLSSSEIVLGAPKSLLDKTYEGIAELFGSGEEHAENPEAGVSQSQDARTEMAVITVSKPDSEESLRDVIEIVTDDVNPMTMEEGHQDSARKSGDGNVPLDDDVATVQPTEINPSDDFSQDHHAEINPINTTQIQEPSKSREVCSNHDDEPFSFYTPAVWEQKVKSMKVPNFDPNSQLPKELYDVIITWLKTKVLAVSDFTDAQKGWRCFKTNNLREVMMVNQILNSDSETIVDFECQLFLGKKTIAEVFKKWNLPLDNREVDIKDVKKKVLLRVEKLKMMTKCIEEMLNNYYTFDLQDNRVVQELTEVFQSGSREVIFEFENWVWSNGGMKFVAAQDEASNENDGSSADFAADAIRNAEQRMSTQQRKKKRGNKKNKKKGNQANKQNVGNGGKGSGSAIQPGNSKDQNPVANSIHLKACEDRSGEISEEQGESSSNAAVPKKLASQTQDARTEMAVPTESKPDSEDPLREVKVVTDDVNLMTNEQGHQNSARFRKNSNGSVPLNDTVPAVQATEIYPKDSPTQDHHAEINPIDITQVQESSKSRSSNHECEMTTKPVLCNSPAVWNQQAESTNVPNFDPNSYLPIKSYDVIMSWLKTKIVAISDLTDARKQWQCFKPRHEAEASMVNQMLSLNSEAIVNFQCQLLLGKKMLNKYSTFDLQDNRIVQKLAEVFQSGSQESTNVGNRGKGSESASQPSNSKDQNPDANSNYSKTCEDGSREISGGQGESSSIAAVPKKIWKTSPFLSLEGIMLEVRGNQDSDWTELRDNSFNKYEKCVDKFANNFNVFEKSNRSFSLKTGQETAVHFLDKKIMGLREAGKNVANFDIDHELHNLDLHYNWGVIILEDEVEKCKELIREDLRQRSNVFRSLRDRIGKLPLKTIMKICFLDSVHVNKNYVMMEHGFIKQQIMSKLKMGR